MWTHHILPASQSDGRTDKKQLKLLFFEFLKRCFHLMKNVRLLFYCYIFQAYFERSLSTFLLSLVWWGISYCCLFNILLKCYFANFFRTIKQYTNDFHHHKLSYIFKILIRGMYNKVGNCTGKYLLGKQQYSRIE